MTVERKDWVVEITQLPQYLQSQHFLPQCVVFCEFGGYRSPAIAHILREEYNIDAIVLHGGVSVLANQPILDDHYLNEEVVQQLIVSIASVPWVVVVLNECEYDMYRSTMDILKYKVEEIGHVFSYGQTIDTLIEQLRQNSIFSIYCPEMEVK